MERYASQSSGHFDGFFHGLGLQNLSQQFNDNNSTITENPQTALNLTKNDDSIAVNSCHLCQQVFSSPWHLKRHINAVHEKQKNHSCNYCGKSFARTDGLRRHHENVHDKPSNESTGIIHDSIREHKDHLIGQIANDERTKIYSPPVVSVPVKPRNHWCMSCGKSFTRLEHLRRHVTTVHEGVKDNTLSLSKFSSQPNSTNNIRGRKICGRCDDSFSTLWHLKRHIQTVHENQRDQKCAFCGKSFSRSEHLKRHIIRLHAHSDETPYPKSPQPY